MLVRTTLNQNSTFTTQWILVASVIWLNVVSIKCHFGHLSFNQMSFIQASFWSSVWGGCKSIYSFRSWSTAEYIIYGSRSWCTVSVELKSEVLSAHGMCRLKGTPAKSDLRPYDRNERKEIDLYYTTVFQLIYSLWRGEEEEKRVMTTWPRALSFISDSLYLWNDKQGPDVWQKWTVQHRPSLFCSSLFESEATVMTVTWRGKLWNNPPSHKSNFLCINIWRIRIYIQSLQMKMFANF